MCVCLSVTTKSATYLIYTWKARYLRVLYGALKVFVMWLSLKMLRSRVMVSFAGHHRFLTPCGELAIFPSTKGTTMASFQLEEYSDRYNNTTGSSLTIAHRDTGRGFLADVHMQATPMMLSLPCFICACALHIL